MDEFFLFSCFFSFFSLFIIQIFQIALPILCQNEVLAIIETSGGRNEAQIAQIA